MTKRSERVWVAVHPQDGLMLRHTQWRKSDVEWSLVDNFHAQWKDIGITIRRATLTLDPVKPKRRRQP